MILRLLFILILISSTLLAPQLQTHASTHREVPSSGLNWNFSSHESIEVEVTEISKTEDGWVLSKVRSIKDDRVWHVYSFDQNGVSVTIQNWAVANKSEDPNDFSLPCFYAYIETPTAQIFVDTFFGEPGKLPVIAHIFPRKKTEPVDNKQLLESYQLLQTALVKCPAEQVARSASQIAESILTSNCCND